jgi:hypothetical protein
LLAFKLEKGTVPPIEMLITIITEQLPVNERLSICVEKRNCDKKRSFSYCDMDKMQTNIEGVQTIWRCVHTDK